MPGVERAVLVGLLRGTVDVFAHAPESAAERSIDEALQVIYLKAGIAPRQFVALVGRLGIEDFDLFCVIVESQYAAAVVSEFVVLLHRIVILEGFDL